MYAGEILVSSDRVAAAPSPLFPALRPAQKLLPGPVQRFVPKVETALFSHPHDCLPQVSPLWSIQTGTKALLLG